MEEDWDEEEDVGDDLGSINAIKRSLGFSRSYEEEEEEEDDDEEEEGDIESDTKCALCISLLCKPVALSCGHAFCRACLAEALSTPTLLNSSGQFRCPTCRKYTCRKCVRRFQVCRPMWSVLQRMFPKAFSGERLSEDESRFLRARAILRGLGGASVGLEGEQGGAHKHGYEVLERDAPLFLPGHPEVRGRRTSVRNAEDYAMHLSLGLRRRPDPLPPHARVVGAGGQWNVCVVMLELEEDEDADGGIPFIIDEGHEDEALIKQSWKGSVVAATLHRVDITVQSANSSDGSAERSLTGVATSPVLECSALFSHGFATLRFGSARPPQPGMYELRLRDEMSGAALTLSFRALAEGSAMPAPLPVMRIRCRVSRCGNDSASSVDEEDEEDEEDENEYDLEDGFLVSDDHLSDDEGVSEEEDHRAGGRRCSGCSDEDNEDCDGAGSSRVDDDDYASRSPPTQRKRKKRKRIVVESDEEEESPTTLHEQ